MFQKQFDVLIIGGSYAGLSAALALGRARKMVVIIDSGKPCNAKVRHSHNFLAHDGDAPKNITIPARKQVLKYKTVEMVSDTAISASGTDNNFEVITESGKAYKGRKLLFATGVTDIMPDIFGFADCWGISLFHCPYCHAYEFSDKRIAVLGNGERAYNGLKIISCWSNKLSLFSNGELQLSAESEEKLRYKNFEKYESPIRQIHHKNGNVKFIELEDGSKVEVDAIYRMVGYIPHCLIPEAMGCEVNEFSFLKIDDFSMTNIKGIYAAGDNTTAFRTISNAVAAGTKAGVAINRNITDESF